MSRFNFCDCPAGFSAAPERHAPDCPGRSGAGKQRTPVPAATPTPKVTAAEELEAVLHWRNKHALAIKERDALQLRLNAADQRIDELTHGQGEQVALMPVDRCYDVRAKQILAFNTSKQAGCDLDDALGAAYKAALRFTPHPGAPAFSSRDDSIGWLKRIDGIGQNRAELIYSMGFRRLAD